MKKLAATILMMLLLLSQVSFVFATNTDTAEIVNGEQVSQIVKIKEKTEAELESYEQKYGSKTYGYVAYALNKIRIYSIPICFIGMVVSALYQYFIGIRRLDIRDKGYHNMVMFITVIVVAQVLPLIFALVVIGWRR